MGKVVQISPHKELPQVYKTCIKMMEAGNLDDAYALIDEQLRQDPNDAQALTVASSIMKRAKKMPIAYSLAQRATAIRPERPEPWDALGNCSQGLWRHEEARSCYEKALKRAKTKEQEAIYQTNLASVGLDLGSFVAAESHCREALAITPEDVSARHNLGLSLLAQRKWKEGWEYYSASIGTDRRLNQKYLPSPGEPTWDGSKDKTVVIYGEQGLGDEICAASMVPDAIKDCGRVILDCDFRLKNLFKRSFPKATVHGTRWEKKLAWPEEDRKIDASIAGFELGKFYRNSDEGFPGTPYLTPCPDRLKMWKALWDKKPVIGIAWSGGTFQNASLYRQLPLSEWKPLFDSIDAHWVSLQYKDASKDIEGTPVRQYPWATLTTDYDDTAALVASCDLVIAVQTSVVHLAGALGVPCWSMIPKTSQWRYGEDYTDLPWYKSVKLIRQKNDKWPIQSMCDDLRKNFA